MPTNAARRPPTFSCSRISCGSTGSPPDTQITSYGAAADQPRGVAGRDFRVEHAVGDQVGSREFGEFRFDVHRQHVLRAMREQCRHITRAGADFQHAFVLLHRQFLQRARFDARRQHVLAGRQRHFEVDEGQFVVRGGDEVFTLDDRQQIQHVLVEHFPGRICCSIMLKRACSMFMVDWRFWFASFAIYPLRGRLSMSLRR